MGLTDMPAKGVNLFDKDGNGITSQASGSQRPLHVIIYDASGNPIVSFGGGTQYTEGDTDASITGTAVIWEDAADTLRAASVAKPLPVQLSDGVDVASIRDVTGAKAQDVAIVDGSGNQITTFGGGTQYTEGDTDATITGTAIMFESNTGANTLSTVNTTTPLPVADAAAENSLSVMDDWDEIDRAKVNPIVGQAGVQGASGVVTALTQRVVLATDVALPAGTNAIGKLSANSGVDIGDVDVTSVVPGTAATNLGKAEDAAHTSGDTGVLLLGVRNDSGGTTFSDTNGDYTPVATTSRGQLFLASVVPGTGATELGKAEDAVHTSGDVGVMSLGVANEANTTLAADGDYVPHAVDREGSTRVIGNRAHDAVDAGNPIKVGYQARQTNPTAVADADRVNAIADDLGRPVVVLNQVRDLVTQQTTTISASTSETTILTAVASTFLDLTLMTLTNTSQTGTRIDIKDSTGGTTRFSMFLVPGGSAVIPFNVPLPQATVNNNWTATCSVSVTDVRIFVQAVKNI